MTNCIAIAIRTSLSNGPVGFWGSVRTSPIFWLRRMSSCCRPYPKGFPFVLLEALAMGCPVVASRVNGVPELIEDHKTGLLVPPRDPQALARAIREATELFNPCIGDGNSRASRGTEAVYSGPNGCEYDGDL